jgi:hypothetical protein
MEDKSIFKISDINFEKTLFKYRDICNKYHERLLFEQELYFSSLDFMNDPYEGHLPIQDISAVSDDDIIEANIKIVKYNNPNQVYTEEVLSMMREDFKNSVPNIRKRFYDNDADNLQAYVKRINNSVGILSLSVDPLNYLMWSHYANSHSGFCVGLNLLKLMKYMDMPYPLAITYQEEIPCWKITDPPFEYAKKYWGTKGLLWEYEQEIRFLSQQYVNKSLKFDVEIIDSIFLGYKMDNYNVEKIMKYFDKNNPKCNIYKIKFMSNLYYLEGEKLN